MPISIKLGFDGSDHLLRRAFEQVGHHDVGAFVGEPLAACPSDAVGAAGHDGDLSLESSHAPTVALDIHP